MRPMMSPLIGSNSSEISVSCGLIPIISTRLRMMVTGSRNTISM